MILVQTYTSKNDNHTGGLSPNCGNLSCVESGMPLMTVSIEQLLSEIGSLNNKLILIVGPSGSGKTQLLRQLGNNLQIVPLDVGLELGRRLAAIPKSKRGFSAGELLREMADQNRTEKPLLLDNLELLFEPSLHVNPLDLVRRLAHAKPVVAVWPGELLICVEFTV